MISKKDSKPFYVKFSVGFSNDETESPVYGNDWSVCYGLISDQSGSIKREIYGYEKPFDKTITVNASSVTRKINYNTLFMVDDMPSNNYLSGDYYVRKIYPEYNGVIVIGLNKIESISLPKLYFVSNNNLIYIQINFDLDKKVAFMKKDFDIPFNIGDYVWFIKPQNVSSENGKMQVVLISKTGFDNNRKDYIAITFEDVK